MALKKGYIIKHVPRDGIQGTKEESSSLGGDQSCFSFNWFVISLSNPASFEAFPPECSSSDRFEHGQALIVAGLSLFLQGSWIPSDSGVVDEQFLWFFF